MHRNCMKGVSNGSQTEHERLTHKAYTLMVSVRRQHQEM